MRDSSIFYRSFYEALKDLPAENQAELYTAIFEYSLNFNEVELSGLSNTIFKLIKPQLQANNKKYENGKKGGKPIQNETKDKPSDNQKETKEEPNVNGNVNGNVNLNGNVNAPRKPRTVFTPPTLDDVISYFKEKGYTETAAKKAFEYYSAGDWKDSKGNQVKNWKQKMLSVWFKDEHKAGKIIEGETLDQKAYREHVEQALKMRS